MNKHKIYLNMCNDLTPMSKCSKHKVGALIVKNNRIISNGLNGTPSGYINCCDKFKGVDVTVEPGRSMHRDWAENFEIHAEMNAVLFATRNGVNLNNSVLYCSLEPCFNCLKHACVAGVKEIYYSKKHKHNLDTAEAQELIHNLGIKIKYVELHE